jgi:hypothetical protein
LDAWVALHAVDALAVAGLFALGGIIEIALSALDWPQVERWLSARPWGRSKPCLLCLLAALALVIDGLAGHCSNRWLLL